MLIVILTLIITRRLQKTKLVRSNSSKEDNGNLIEKTHAPTLSMTLSVDSTDDISMKHFKIDPSRILGTGGFGCVCHAKKRSGLDKSTNYAIKLMSKYDVLQRTSGITAVMNELKALILLVDDSFICGLHYAFQDDRCIYLVLDLCKGGDLRYNLRISPNNRFTEERARFYFCQILLALDSCHKRKILHRDVKPENILLTGNHHHHYHYHFHFLHFLHQIQVMLN